MDFSSRSSSDRRSGRGFSYEAQFKHALLQVDTGRKGADSPVVRDKPAISPRNVSDSEWIFPRIYKKIISRDTNCPFGRTLPEITPNRLACQALRESGALSMSTKLVRGLV